MFHDFPLGINQLECMQLIGINVRQYLLIAMPIPTGSAEFNNLVSSVTQGRSDSSPLADPYAF